MQGFHDSVSSVLHEIDDGIARDFLILCAVLNKYTTISVVSGGFNEDASVQGPQLVDLQSTLSKVERLRWVAQVNKNVFAAGSMTGWLIPGNQCQHGTLTAGKLRVGNCEFLGIVLSGHTLPEHRLCYPA